MWARNTSFEGSETLSTSKDAVDDTLDTLRGSSRCYKNISLSALRTHHWENMGGSFVHPFIPLTHLFCVRDYASPRKGVRETVVSSSIEEERLSLALGSERNPSISVLIQRAPKNIMNNDIPVPAVSTA